MKNNLQDKFEDFGSIPSPDVWDKIERELNRKKKKRSLVFWFSSGLAATLLLFVYLNFNADPQLKVSQTPSKQKQTSGLSSQATWSSSKNSESKENTSPVPENKTPKDNNKDHSAYKVVYKPEKKLENQDFKLENTLNKKPNFDSLLVIKSRQLDSSMNQSAWVEKDSVSKQETKDSSDLASQTTSDSSLVVEKNKDQNQDSTVQGPGKWFFEIKLASWDAKNNRDQLTSDNTAAAFLFAEDLQSFVGTNSNPTPSSDYKKASLFKPISLGLHANYRTSKKWVFSSGLNFDYMQSRLENSSSISTSRFVSLGVPLAFGYEFRADKKLSILPRLSVRNDFIVGHFNKEETLASESAIQKNTKEVNFLAYQSALQFELNLKYNFSAKSSLTLAPVSNYYFLQKFKTENIKILERKLWYGIQLGYCFHI